MAMTQEEKIEIADMVRSRDRFGPQPNCSAAGKRNKLWIFKNGKTVACF